MSVRIDKLDNVKFILTLLMCLYHIQFMGDSFFRNAFLAIKNLGDCVVPAFAIISGILFWKNVHNLNDVKNKICRRFMTLLLPYFLWNVIFSIIQYAINKESYYTAVNFIYRNIFLWDSSPHFWYIFMLMFWTVLSPILYCVYKNKYLFIFFVVFQFVYLLIMGNNILHSRFIYLIYTWAGYIGWKYGNELKHIVILNEYHKKNKLICILILYVIIYVIYSVLSVPPFLKVWLYLFRALILLVFLYNYPKKNDLISTFSKYSFWLFVVHYWMDHYISNIVFRCVSFTPLYHILTYLIVIVCGIGSGKIVQRIFPAVYDLLCGKRNIYTK